MPILSKHVFCFFNFIFGVRVILAYWEGGYLNSLLLGVDLKVMGFEGFFSRYGRRSYCIVLLKNCLVVFQGKKKYGSLLKIKAIMQYCNFCCSVLFFLRHVVIKSDCQFGNLQQPKIYWWRDLKLLQRDIYKKYSAQYETN